MSRRPRRPAVRALLAALCLAASAATGAAQAPLPAAPARAAAGPASPAPVNPAASAGARALLRYLYEQRGRGLLAGQHNYNQEPGRFTARAEQLGGAAPAVWGTDFIWNGAEDPGPRVVDEAIRRWREGSVVTLMWHAGRPQDDPPFAWSTSIQGEMTAAEWRELVTPGTPLHRRWERQVDAVAGHLARLRDAGVPVLWRPYHEMNGVWFWWGDKRGPGGYAALYRMLYDRFTRVHKLDNLLWVWDANAPRDIPRDQAYAYADFYPGAAYVDVLATDVYNFDYEQRDYDELVRLAAGKPVALGEVGELPKPEILDAQPLWSWFMVWANWLETHNTPERVRSVYAYPRTLTRDEVRLARP